MTLVHLLVYVVVLCLVFGVAYHVIKNPELLPIREPFRQFALIGLAVLFLVLLLGALFGLIPIPPWPVYPR